LVSIDLSSAFDMVEYNILVNKLYTSFGISGTAFSWICSYLKRRSQCVSAGQSSSRYSGMPQGSVLGSLLFSVYTSPISFIASDLGISLQQYADDTQLYILVSADDLTVHRNSLESCLQSLHLWLCHNGLGLNSGKSESILFSTSSRIRNFPSVSDVNIAGTLVPISDKIITLGVTLDRHLALSHRISNVYRAAYLHTRSSPHQTFTYGRHGYHSGYLNGSLTLRLPRKLSFHGHTNTKTAVST